MFHQRRSFKFKYMLTLTYNFSTFLSRKTSTYDVTLIKLIGFFPLNSGDGPSASNSTDSFLH